MIEPRHPVFNAFELNIGLVYPGYDVYVAFRCGCGSTQLPIGTRIPLFCVDHRNAWLCDGGPWPRLQERRINQT